MKPCACGGKHPAQRGVFYRADRAGAHWVEYYDADGRRHREKVGSFPAACDAYFERRLQVREGKFQAPRAASITFRELVKECLADRRDRLAPRTIDGDRQRAQRLLAWFGPLAAAKVTPALIAARLRELRDEGLGGSATNRFWALLSAIYSWGLDQDKVRENPASRVKRYPENPSRKRRLDLSEEAALLQAIRRDFPDREPEIEIVMNTGLRRNEFYRLTWDQVDLDLRLLTVYGKRHANSQASNHRYVRLNEAAVEAFRKLHALSQGSPFVVPGKHRYAGSGDEVHDRDRRRWFEIAVERAGIDNFRYHDLRHTAGSRAAMNGAGVPQIMDLLGHRTPEMAMKYIHLSPEHSQAVVDRLGEFNREMRAAVEREIAKAAAPVARMPARRPAKGVRGGARPEGSDSPNRAGESWPTATSTATRRQAARGDSVK